MWPVEPRTIREPKETTLLRRVKPGFQKPVRLVGYASPRRPVSKHTPPTTPKTPAGVPTEIATTIPEPASVNSTLSFHPLAEIFPLLDDDRLQALANDIAARGLLDEIALYEGKILDGRRRYLACLRAGVAPKFQDYVGDDALGFVIGRNVHRRHLTKIQSVLAAARAATLPVGSNQTTPGLPIGRAAEIFEVSERNIARAKTICARVWQTLFGQLKLG